MKKLFIPILILFGFVIFIIGVSATEKHSSISITILYDNYIFTKGLKADWGFSCLIEGTEEPILFDTGFREDTFSHNINILNKDLNNVRHVVISHDHYDHTGNLLAFLKENNNIVVYLPASFQDDLYLKDIKATNAMVTPVLNSIEICQDVFLTGDMDSPVIKEQSMIIDTDKGLILIAGCAHPGIINIVRKAKKLIDKDIYLLIGGFHLLNETKTNILHLIGQLKKSGVLNVAPTHCTGDKAIALFKKEFGKNYIQTGVGKTLKFRKKPPSDYTLPAKIDPNSRYFLFMHNYYVEMNGPSDACDYYGILKAFRERGLNIISEVRPEQVIPEKYAKKVAQQVIRLLKAGVPSKNIVVSGHSKGGYMVLHVADLLEDPGIRYVVMAGCGIGVFPKPPRTRQGQFLSILDTDDQIAKTCHDVFNNLPQGMKTREVLLETGKGHRLFFTPDKVWIDPVMEWINQE